jgi:WD40 repeat protein/tRNA A-37 threonylcarbamoyl transferase component Bud32
LVPEWVDAVADQFEAAWQTLTLPRIAAFLGDETGERRVALLMELIQVDAACRARIGSQRSLADYGDDFPEIRQRLANDIAQPTPLPQKLVSQKTLTDHPSIAGYEILGELGEGGMGVVYKARQVRLGRVVALKMILAGAKARRRDLTRFQTEMEAVARLQHPNIVQLYEVGEHDGQPYCALEYVDGGNLAQKLAGTPQPARQAAQLVETLARAIHAAHQQHVIHRDLKPANVLLTTDGTPKISDFGLAKQLTGGSESEALLRHVTQTGEVVGTPSYIAPEQAQGKPHDVGAPADIYGLGAILYELLTGRPPFKGETTLDTLQQVRTQEPVAPSRLQPKLPRDLTTICLKALAKVPGHRFATASDLADDLRRFLDGKPIHARSVSGSEKLLRWCRRNPFVAIPSVAAALLLVGFVIVLSVSTVLVWRANQELRQNLYYQHIALAEREWSANNLSRVEQLLEACPSDLRGWEWRCLKRLRLGDIPPLRHEAAVLSAVFSPDGRWIASGSQDGRVTLWDASTGLQRLWFRAHLNHVRCIAFSPDGRRLATASWDRTAKIWDFDPQRAGGEITLLNPLTGHQSEVSSVTFSPDSERIAIAGDGKTVSVWDVATGQQILVLRGPGKLGSSVAFSPDGQRIAAASNGTDMTIWNARTGLELCTWRGHSGPVASVTFSRDGRWLASTTADSSTQTDGMITIWDARTGDEVRTLRGHTGLVFHATFSPDGNRLASVGRDETVRLWDLHSGQDVLTLRRHRGQVRCVDFSPDGNRLVSAGHDGTVQIWDATPLGREAEQEPLTLTSHHGGVLGVAFSSDGQWLASAGGDGTVCLWDYTHRQAGGAIPLIGRLDSCIGSNTKVVFSQNGQFLASGSGGGHRGGQLKLWDRDRSTWKEHPLPPGCGAPIAFSPDDELLAVVSPWFAIDLLDARTGQKARPTLQGHGWAIFGVAFDPRPNVSRLASASADRTVRIWDVRTGKEIQDPPLRHTNDVRGVAFSQDGRFLASGGHDRVVKIWNAETWNLFHELTDPTGAVECVAFHPKDSRLLAWGGTDSTVKVWNGATDETRTLHGHLSSIWGVAFSPDGESIASASLDGTVKIWKTPWP